MTAFIRGRSARVLFIVALGAGVAIAALARLAPPSALRLAQLPPNPRELAGSFHVHTTMSDGSGSVEEIAEAAASSGLRFVVFTDHGDGTRAPAPPRYLSGVLCITGVEIGTTGGHYIALGLHGPAPYPLAGEPRDVVEDVQRLGGFGIVSHPDSPKPELRWRDWTAPVPALEWLNGDSEWRDEPPRRIARAVATYFVRPPEVIASLLTRRTALERWDIVARRSRVVGVAGHDAHARIGLRGDPEPGVDQFSVRLPSYRSVFRTFSQRVVLDRVPTGDAAQDAGLVLRALEAGHTYTVVDAFAAPARLSFEAETAGRTARGGDDLSTSAPVRLTARVPHAPGVSLVLFRNGRVARSVAGPTIEHTHHPSGEIAVYRVEARLPNRAAGESVPWIVSNPIWIASAIDRTPARVEPPPSEAARRIFGGVEEGSWRIEKDGATAASIDVGIAPWGGRGLRLSYRLASGVPRGQYAAAVAALDPTKLPDWDRVRFRAAASPEMRISVQVREPKTGRRWRRSVVLDRAPRESVVRLDAMSFVEPVLAGRPPRGKLDTLLFVVDTTNARPGAEGTVWIGDIDLEREEKSRQVRTVSSM
jgi:hypothetical protein